VYGRNVAFQKVVELGAAAISAREQADIFHGTDFSVPYLPLRPSVMTVFDLSPWRTADLTGFAVGQPVAGDSDTARRW